VVFPARIAASYFGDSPWRNVFIVIFLGGSPARVYLSSRRASLERNQADLQVHFFRWHPWLYLVLIPGRLDAAFGQRSATAAASNCSMTFPITLWQAGGWGQFLGGPGASAGIAPRR